MNKLTCLLTCLAALNVVDPTEAAEPKAGESPAGHLPPHITQLDGSGRYERLTYFSDYPGYKASNPVVSDDGKFIAFQMAKAREAAGIGHGIFVFDITKAGEQARTSGGAAYHFVADFPRLPDGWSLGAVSGVATDSTGNVLVFHRGEHPILVFDHHGKFLRSFGEGMFASAHGLRVDANDNIWVTDNANHTVIKFSHDGKALMTLGEKNVAGEDADHFNKPTDIGFASNGDFYIADGYGNSRVVKFNKEGKFLMAWGKKGAGPGEFNLPHAIQLDAAGHVYVGDRENDRVQVFDANGRFLRQFGGFAPFGLFITPDETLFVADGRANRIIKMTLDGKVLVSWGATGVEPGDFQMPHGLTVAGDGAVYVSEITGKRVQRFVAK